MRRTTAALVLLLGTGLLGLTLGCKPAVGSEAWCKMMKEKPKGDWSANEAADYAKHCLMR